MGNPTVTTLDSVARGTANLSGTQTGNMLIEIEPGFYLGRTDMAIGNGMTYGSQTFPFAAMSVLLEGRITTHDAGMEELEPNAMLAIANSEERELLSSFHGAERLRNVEVFVTPDWFGNSSRFHEGPEFDHLREAMRRPMKSQRRMMDPRIRTVAEMTLKAHSNGPLAAMRLEAWALDLLAELIMSFQEPTRPLPLSPVDRDRIQAVHDLLETRPETAGSLGELARQHGVSASKLKRDFFIAYQTCVGGFANTQRLLLGKRLLEEGMSVSQVAYRIGYSHPANFSAAFKRHFGLTPRDVRR